MSALALTEQICQVFLEVLANLKVASLRFNSGRCFSGKEAGTWFVDLKTGNGSYGSGSPASKPDVTMTCNDDVFQQMFQGKGRVSLLLGGHGMGLEPVTLCSLFAVRGVGVQYPSSLR